MAQKTITNLLVLKKAQEEVKLKLGKKYNETIKTFVTIITKVMAANKCNEFEALKLIKDNLSIYKEPGAAQCFSAAIIEITEAKHFSELKE